MEQITTFNPVQRHLLQMFGYFKSEKTLSELRGVLLKYYAEKTQESIDEFWDKNMNEDSFDQILSEHMRTPYAHAK